VKQQLLNCLPHELVAESHAGVGSNKVYNKQPNPEVDEQLTELVLLAQQHPHLSPKRQVALTKLVNIIMKSGKLCRPQCDILTHIYEEIYKESLQKLFFFICQNIDKYNVEDGTVVTWVNELLKKRFFPEALIRVSEMDEIQRMTITELDRLQIQ
jgi:hypothetical protein